MKKIKNMKLRSKLLLSVFAIDILFSILLVAVFGIIATNLRDLTSVTQILATLKIVSVAAGVVLFVLSAWFAVRLAKTISKPAQELKQAAEDLAQGNLHVHVNYDSQDELGTLARSLNSFCDELNKAISELIRLLDGLSEGDLTVKSDYVWKGDWGQINVATKKITKSLNALFTSINDAADQTSSGAEQVSSGAQALAQGATEQASSIEELSATIMEISEHVKKTASNAAEANRASSVEKEKLTDASSEMEEMVKAMAEISETSTKISNIIKTIDDIAFQTNILALNAAVEAARAGSAGKGFAVVADEVRNLASKSAEAAKNTTALIENAIKAVSNGTKVAGSTEKTLNEVMETATDANRLVNEIAEASNQQATSINQITQGVQQISAVVQTNSATAEQSAAASEELSAQAKGLKQSLSGLKLKKQEPAVQQSAAGKPSEHKSAEARPVTARRSAAPVLADKY